MPNHLQPTLSSMALAWLSCLSLAFGAADYRSVSFVEVLRFRGGAGTEELLALRAVHTGPQGQIRRALVETPAGALLVITVVVRPVAGTYTTRIVDDETGWWLEMSNSYPVRADTLDEFHTKLSKQTQPPPFSSRITTRNGFSAAVEAVTGTDEVAEVVQSLQNGGVLEGLARAVPDSVRTRLAALNALAQSRFEGDDEWKVFTLEGDRLARIALLGLAASGVVDAEAAAGDWIVEAEKPQSWSRIGDPRVLGVVERLRSIGPEKVPLSDEDIRRLLQISELR